MVASLLLVGNRLLIGNRQSAVGSRADRPLLGADLTGSALPTADCRLPTAAGAKLRLPTAGTGAS
jgi:hypothetical protein